MFDVPSYIWALTLIGVIGIPSTTAMMLYRGGLAAGVSRRTTIIVAAAAASILAAWIVATFLLVRAGVYHSASGRAEPWFGLAFGVALTAFLLATRIPVMKRILSAPGMPARLAVPNAFRVVGLAFVIVMLLGGLPAVFALPAGLGDFAVGVTTPFVARRLYCDPTDDGAVRFNALGIADLVVALATGFLSGIGPVVLFEVTPTTEALTLLPLALVPTFAVPLTLTLHVVSLARLRAERRTRSERPRLMAAA